MKPRKITMQAFGPYLNETAIDFTRLYGDGLFLITGSTGCGKTTILDAMSYALYGRATGSVRDVRDMRSIAAPDSLETSVSFEFDLGETIYKFERGIKIREIKRRAGGTDRVPDYSESCYIFSDGTWNLICSGSNVKDKAAELLGFSHEQFSQVVVLPQGEFRRLLTAPSLEKQKILEVLFGTSRWQVFTKALSERSKAIDAALSDCGTRKAALIKGANCADSEELYGRLSQSETAYAQISGAIKALSDAYAQASANYSGACELDGKFTELEAVRKRLAELIVQTENINKKRQSLIFAEKAEKLMPYKQTMEQAAAELGNAKKTEHTCLSKLEEAKVQLQAAQKELEGCADGDDRLSKLSAQTAKLEAILGPSKTLGQALSQLKNEKIALGKAKLNAADAEKDAQRLTSELENLNKEIKENYEGSVVKLPEIEAEKTRLEAQAQSFLKLHEQKKTAVALEKQLLKKRGEYKSTNQTLKNEKHVLEKLQAALDGDSAYKLSHLLHDGAPCPVCGSTSHPTPALPSQGAPTREELETQKNIVSGLEEKLRIMGEEGGKLSGEAQSAQNRFLELKAECEKYSASESETAEKLAMNKKLLEAARKSAQKQKPMEEKATLIEKSLGEAKTRYENIKTELEKTAAGVSKLEGRVVELSEAVPEELRDSNAVELKIESIKCEYTKLSQRIKVAREHGESARSALAAASGRLVSAKENISAAEKRLCTARNDYEKQFAKSGLTQNTDINVLVLTQKKKEEIKAAVEGYDNEILLQKDKEKRLVGQLGELKRPDLAVIKGEVEVKREAAERAATQKGSLESEIKNLKHIKVQLDETVKKEERLRRDYALYDHVYRLCSGENALKTPIHQFVLGLMLEDIVACANGHLWELSRGRYSIVRSTSLSRGGGSKGLDLSVEDAWSGGERSVNTLSGGEMFLASLSLAFGLSDVVQSYAGGIRLDSLFIDEGFGSLDVETLDTAMSVLERLRRSGRLIGVISHVSELRGRIPGHIEVTRQSDGTASAKVFGALR